MTIQTLFEPNKHIIDFSQMAMASLSANFKDFKMLNKQLIKASILDSIRANVKKFSTQYPEVILAVDSKTGYWRRDYFPFYKKHRALVKEGSELDWQLIYESFNELSLDIKENFPYTVIMLDKVEADDIIGVLTNRFKHDCGILINASDSDFTQLQQNGNVVQWSPNLKKYVKPKYGSAKKDLIYKILKGDYKDTIAPIKCASDFVYQKALDKKNGISNNSRAPSVTTKELELAYSTDDLYSLYDGELLVRFKENELLLDLSKIPIEYVQSINNEYNTYVKQPKRKIYPYLIKNRLTKLANNISDF